MKHTCKRLFAIILGISLFLLCTACQEEAEDGSLNAGMIYYADIVVKDYGTIVVRLEPDAAPVTVQNFVTLARSGFYDGLTFHRIIAGFMIQGGDPLGNGLGGSEKKIPGEFAANGYNNPIPHVRGVISMARAKDPNSASSQFFIVHRDGQQRLNGYYAAFGYVVEGMEVVDEICAVARPIDGNGGIAPSAQPVIESITIRTESK
jgi:peptidyl-prolyl cis-trans isomerase B (cyclophilin B)